VPRIDPWLRRGAAILLVALVGCSSGSARQGLGGACGGDTDCQVGLFCVGDDPGGQCTKSCSGDGQCGAGNICNPEGKCYPVCTTSSDCPRAATDPRYGCIGSAPRRFCDVLDQIEDGGATKG
jgi:hypothetical protein